MRAFITGGAGFVGSHLAQALLERATTSTSSTTSPRLDRQHRAPQGKPRFHYTIDSVLNEPVLASS